MTSLRTFYILLTVAVLSVAIAVVFKTKEVTPDKMNPSELTMAKLKRIDIQLLQFYSAKHRWPIPSNWKQDLKPYLEADGFFPFDGVTVDGWGSQIQCIENTNGSGLILRSLGRNRVDDHGSNYDITVVVEAP